LYRLLLRGALPVAAPLLWLTARVRGKSRPSLRARLRPRLAGLRPGGLWVQAVSVGEVELSRRLLAELEGRAPEMPLLLTATTTTGLALARRTVGDRVCVHACPLDLPAPVGRVLDSVRPRLLVLVETELWPELLHQAACREIPVAVANARLSEESFPRYRRVRGLLRPLLEPLTAVLARSDADAGRFAELGVPEDRIQTLGNIKYDLEPSPDPLPWQELVRPWAAGRPVVVAGSTMDGEEHAVLEAVSAIGGSRRLFLVVAPRHPERFDGVRRQLEERGINLALRSALDPAPATADALLLDTIGELGRAYRFAEAAFIGGSLVPTGGHNPLEPAVWSVPVLTGPHVHNFQEIYGGAVMVADSRGLAEALGSWLDDGEAARAAGSAALSVVERNRGATARTAIELLALAGR